LSGLRRLYANLAYRSGFSVLRFSIHLAFSSCSPTSDRRRRFNGCDQSGETQSKKKDKVGLAKLLPDDFTEITEDGVFDKAQILANLDNLTLTSYSPGDFKARTIAPNVVLLIYQVTVIGKYKDHDFQADSNAAS
jgi:hypothetical protein